MVARPMLEGQSAREAVGGNMRCERKRNKWSMASASSRWRRRGRWTTLVRSGAGNIPSTVSSSFSDRQQIKDSVSRFGNNSRALWMAYSAGAWLMLEEERTAQWSNLRRDRDMYRAAGGWKCEC
ncbi:hypothetical protein GSI_10151 [Ganoderma sinense ZZ0214-1]|uniref:Uncharacterized protein n=1 Tax=Ganoderma sinense ZZ0214-1 TaxID=1077348 RepID=A0A2G8RZR9_9APHY|nr:hypothetical protein GSI_10151 [Ganoderma sinense ZZ0214-1]